MFVLFHVMKCHRYNVVCKWPAPYIQSQYAYTGFDPILQRAKTQLETLWTKARQRQYMLTPKNPSPLNSRTNSALTMTSDDVRSQGKLSEVR